MFGDELDLLLRGGVQCGHLTEFSGAPGLGKTQLCFQLALSNCLKGKRNGVLYIDSEGAFSASRYSFIIFLKTIYMLMTTTDFLKLIARLLEIAIHKYGPCIKEDIENCLRRIHVWRPDSLADIIDKYLPDKYNYNISILSNNLFFWKNDQHWSSDHQRTDRAGYHRFEYVYNYLFNYFVLLWFNTLSFQWAQSFDVSLAQRRVSNAVLKCVHWAPVSSGSPMITEWRLLLQITSRLKSAAWTRLATITITPPFRHWARRGATGSTAACTSPSKMVEESLSSPNHPSCPSWKSSSISVRKELNFLNELKIFLLWRNIAAFVTRKQIIKYVLLVV